MPDELSTWNEWGKHVLKELERQGAQIEKLFELNGKLQVDVQSLVTKAAIFSGMSALVVTIAAPILIKLISKL